MIAAEQTYIRSQLEQRRERLSEARRSSAEPSLSTLLHEVDAALAHGMFQVFRDQVFRRPIPGFRRILRDQ